MMIQDFGMWHCVGGGWMVLMSCSMWQCVIRWVVLMSCSMWQCIIRWVVLMSCSMWQCVIRWVVLMSCSMWQCVIRWVVLMSCSMWQCVIRWVVPDFWKEHHAFFFKGQTVQEVMVWPFKWGHYIALKYWELVTQQHGITYQKAWILGNTTARTSNHMNC